MTPILKEQITEIEVKTPLVRCPLPSWCKTNGLNNAEVMLAFGVLDRFFWDYMTDKLFIDTTANDCRYGEECDKRLCRSYKLGRVIGAQRYARSTSVNVGSLFSWSGTTITVKITEHQPDDTVDIDQITTDIHKELKKALKDDTSVNIITRADSG